MSVATLRQRFSAPEPRPEIRVPPPLLEAVGISKRFGTQTVLDRVDLRLRPGSFHALLGENGAGKSTLVKCIMGYYHADAGGLLADNRERTMASTRDAHALGIGMVYQHFTLVPNMTVLENLVLARPDLAMVIDWRAERARVVDLMATMPFQVDPDCRISALSAGEKQKVEILKQLFLRRRILILDEPTSVLTPDEADQMLVALRAMTERGELTVLMITHKFREVMAYADEYTVLRKGRQVGTGRVSETDVATLSRLMVGEGAMVNVAANARPPRGGLQLEIKALSAESERGASALKNLSIHLHCGEILGIAGVSGNGQRELVEVLAGQRQPTAGSIRVGGSPYRGTRAEMRHLRIFCLPEEPLRNACVPRMGLAENLALRDFDTAPFTRWRAFLSGRAIIEAAHALIQRFRIHPPSPTNEIETLSGGNVQRSVLARELSRDSAVLICADPCFGLDFAATAKIRGELAGARNGGAAVLLLSTDLDEIFELADRIAVLFEGRIVYEADIGEADRVLVGRAMAGQ